MRRLGSLRPALLAPMLLVGAANVQAAEWQWSGDTTTQADWYDNHGNAAVSPNQHAGTHLLNSTTLNFNKAVSNYEFLQGQASGRAIDSEYVGDFQDLVVDRVSLVWQKGDAAIPFRLSGGDYFAFLSPRTIQRSLKGAQLELQPSMPGLIDGAQHSIILFGGVNEASYRDFSLTDETSSGASWLVGLGELGQYSLNILRNERRTLANPATIGVHQNIVSFGGNKRFEASENTLGQRVDVEFELASFEGAHDNGGVLNDAVGGEALFARIAGSDVDQDSGERWTYSWEHERNDNDFRALTSSVTADRDSDAVRVSWQNRDGMRVSGRLLSDTSNKSQADPVENTTYGVSLSAPLADKYAMGLRNPQVSVDLVNLLSQSLTRATNQRSYSLNAGLAGGLENGWNLNLRGAFQDTDNLNANTGTLLRDIALSASRSVDIGGYRGAIAPGISYRQNRGTGHSDEIAFNFSGDLERGPHSWRMTLRNFDQQRPLNSNTDVQTHDFALRYSYASGPHRVSIEGSSQRRLDESTANNTLAHLGLTYSFQFDNAPETLGTAGAESFVPGVNLAERGIDAFRLADLPPNLNIADAIAYLDSVGIKNVTQQACCQVAQAQVFDNIDARQQVYLESDVGQLTRSGVIFDRAESPADLSNQLNRLIEALSKRYGAPQTALEEGAISANFAADVNSGQLVRLYQWQTRFGLIRAGLSRRLDGDARIEVAHARRFGPLAANRWAQDDL